MDNLLPGLNYNVKEYDIQAREYIKSQLQYLYFEDVYPIDVEGEFDVIDIDLMILMSNGDKIAFTYKETQDNYVDINNEHKFAWEHSLFVEDQIPIDNGYVISKVYRMYLDNKNRLRS